MRDLNKKKCLQKLKNYRDFHDYTIDNLRKYPEDIETYLEVAIEDYDKGKNTEAFLLALRTIVEAKDSMSGLAKKTNLSRQALYKALSPKGNPRLETIWSILNALGYTFSIKSI